MLPEIHDDVLLGDELDDLEDAILMRAKPGAPYPGGANRGGWKSTVDLLSWPGLIFSKVKLVLALLLADKRYEPRSAWAVVNRNGSYHGRHRHGVPIMGILFVTSGDPPVPTVFETEHGANIEVFPKPGRVVLCSDLYHWVPRYSGELPRIVVAFDGKRPYA